MTAKITGDNSVVPLNKVKDDTSVFVRLWQRGKKILTPFRDILDTIADVGSNFAPEYAKKPYKVNSYVMNDGILYTNENAINTAEDWNPDHWTQTTVAEAIAKNGQDMKDMEGMYLINLPCAANTFRFEFSKMDYDPTVAGVGSSGTWKKLNAKFHNVWDWTGSGTSFEETFLYAFEDIDNFVSVIAVGDTSVVTNMNSMFLGCTSLTSVPLFDTSAVTDMGYMFQDCTSLTSVPLFDTSAVKNMYSMFSGCTSLTSVPLFDTSAVTDMRYMFKECIKVEGGALALYQQASTQTTPPSNHTDTFTNCGKDTVTGAAELAQIPASWGGTALAEQEEVNNG